MTTKEVIEELAQIGLDTKNHRDRSVIIEAINLLMVHAMNDGEIVSIPKGLKK